MQQVADMIANLVGSIPGTKMAKWGVMDAKVGEAKEVPWVQEMTIGGGEVVQVRYPWCEKWPYRMGGDANWVNGKQGHDLTAREMLSGGRHGVTTREMMFSIG